MSDLISRSAVIDIIHKEIERTTSFAEHQTQINIEMAVKELPIAYDKEAVVEQLEKLTNNYEEGCTDRIRKGLCFKAEDCGRCAFLQSIDIVKAGGIDG